MRKHTPTQAKILVVDDEIPVCEALAYTLQQEGYDTVWSHDLDKAVELLRRGGFELVLSDVRIPGVKGLGSLDRIHKAAPDIPVMLISGYGTPREAAEAMRHGAADYLEKPVEASDLLDSVSRALKAAGSATAEKSRLQTALDALSAARAKALQDESLKALGLFTVGIAHEISNPLSAILGFADLLMGDTGLGDRTKADVREIKRQASHCRELTHMLLRQIRGRPPARISVSVDEAVTGAFKLARPSTTFRRVRLGVALGAPQARIRASATEIQQIVLNLLSNAAAAVEGQPGAQVGLRTHERKGAVEITVSDNGPGIPPERLEHIFEPFFSTKGERGSGLGLSLSRTLVEQLGGCISVRSEPGRGAVFTARFPKEG